MTVVVSQVYELQFVAATVAILTSPVSVPAGYPSPSQDYFDKGIDLNAHLIKDSTCTFIVRVSGDSMTGAGISDGDELIVDGPSHRSTATWSSPCSTES